MVPATVAPEVPRGTPGSTKQEQGGWLVGKEIKLEGGGRTLRINGEIVDQQGKPILSGGKPILGTA